MYITDDYLIDMKLSSTSIVLMTIMIAACGIFCIAGAAAQSSVNGSISGQVIPSNGIYSPEIRVALVNATNTSEEYPDFNTTLNENGYFQFVNVPPGQYIAVAWSPYHEDSMSNPLNVVSRSTSTCSISLIPKPYYVDLVADPTHVLLDGGKASITATVYDYWNKPVGKGWFITLSTTAGTLDPAYGETDSNGVFSSTLTAPQTGSNATVEAYARAANNTYYRLFQYIDTNVTTPTPTAIASVTPTATHGANVTTPTPTGIPTATPAPTSTPGFEVIAALMAICIAVAIKKFY